MPKFIAITEVSRELSLNEQGYYTGVRVWKMETDKPDTTTVVDAEDEAPVAVYDPFPGRPMAVARGFSAVRATDSDSVYILTVQYSGTPMPAMSGAFPTAENPASPVAPSSSNNGQQSAEFRLPSFTVDEITTNKPRVRDINNKPVQNTAGDPIEGVETPETAFLITIEWWSIAIDVAHLRRFRGKVNASAYGDFPAETLRVKSLKVVSQFENFNGFYARLNKCTAVLEENPDGWNQLRVLNAGKRQRVGGAFNGLGEPSGGVIRACVDATGQPASDPIPLGALGEQLPSGDTVHWLYFDFYETDDFSQLMV